VLVPAKTLNKVVSQATTAIASIDTNASGDKFALLYSLRCGYNVSFAGQLRARVSWASNPGAGAGATGRIFVEVRRKDTSGNVSTIPGLVRGYGSTRSVAGVSNYVENQIVVNIPPQTFAPGESLVAVVGFEILATFAAAALTVTIKTNPNSAGDELLIELDAGTP